MNFEKTGKTPVNQTTIEIIKNKNVSKPDTSFKGAEPEKTETEKLKRVPGEVARASLGIQDTSKKQTEKIDIEKERKEFAEKLVELDGSSRDSDISYICDHINEENLPYFKKLLNKKNLDFDSILSISVDFDYSDKDSKEKFYTLMKDDNVPCNYVEQIVSNDDFFNFYKENIETMKKIMDSNIKLRSVPKDMLKDKKLIEKITDDLQKSIEKYGISSETELKFYNFEHNNPNDLFTTINGETDKNEPLTYKFDKDSGKLLSISVGEKTIKTESDTVIIDKVKTRKKSNASLNDSIPIVIHSKKKLKRGTAETTYIESEIKGQYNIYHKTPDGKKARIGHALVEPDGTKHVRRTLVSSDGTRNFVAYREDVKGNSYLHTVIKDKEGNILSEVKRNFKVLSDNHFISDKNGQSYDIEFTDKKVSVTKLDSDKNKTEEVVEYRIEDFPVDKADDIFNQLDLRYSFDEAKNIFKSAGIKPRVIDRRFVDMLKKLPGDEWFEMAKSAEYILPTEYFSGNACYGGDSIFISDDMKDNLGVFCHELGHAKIHKTDLLKDDDLNEIYEQEKLVFTSTYPESRIYSADYFLNDNCDDMSGLEELCAETNLTFDTIQSFEELQDRTLFLEQHFPKTMAYIRNHYNK